MDTTRRSCTAWLLAAALAGSSGALLEFGPVLRDLLRAGTQLIHSPASPPPAADATVGVRA